MFSAMEETDLAFAGIAEQARLLRAGEIKSAELVSLYLSRIERINPRLNAFTDVFAEQALADAAAAATVPATASRRPSFSNLITRQPRCFATCASWASGLTATGLPTSSSIGRSE